jgi:hypothetical protein
MSARSRGGPDVNRLLDIVVEEVSLVDRAANKHRFLIVKRSDEMDETTTNPTAPADEPSAEGNPADADKATPTGETNNPDAAGATDDGQDEPSLAVAVAALEGITEAVELLGNLGEDDARTRLAELAGDLRSASERLAEAAGAGSADADAAGDQDGDDPPKGAPDVSAVLDAVRATLQRVDGLLKEPSSDSASTATDDNAAAGDTRLGEQLTELVGELRTLTSTVKEQQQRLARLEKRFGLPNSAPSGERPAKPEEDDLGWPMDLNRPFDRESVDKATSFHDV